MLCLKYSAEKLGYKTEITNAIQVARNFLTLVSTYGEIGCINHRAPSDQRFKLTRNGSYYDKTVVYHGERMLRGDAYIKHMLTYGD